VKEKREFDLVLWGATSFVGKIIAEYLLRRVGAQGDVRWALAARNLDKLEDLQKALGPESADIPLLVGDSFDSEFLREMAAKTKVVLTTVGPYQKYGETLVEACALKGTDYCDLTGEITFVQSMMDKYQNAAEESGARIVNCAGFDSLPSDLGVLYLNDFAKKTFKSTLKAVEMQVRAAKGGVSGGTIASAVETVTQIRNDPSLAKVLQNPYAACPADQRAGVRQPSLFGAKRSQYNGDWLHQFIMAPVNTKIVHATNARLDYPLGRDFIYTEWQVAPSPVKAYIREFSIAVMLLAMYFPWTRSVLTRFVLPQPGDGPTLQMQESGYFKLEFHGLTQEGHNVTCRVTGDADPGYGSTAKQISEVALGLIRTRGSDAKAGGFWTPGSCLGLQLVEPLVEHAGLTFDASPA
jgi:short subunit dehydrogenase-like uncharacterized protein